MKLHIVLDEERMRSDASRGASPNFEIYWTNDRISYPAPGWTDFGLVIVDWWNVAAERLLHGSMTDRLLFMDGPYELRVKRNGDELLVTAADIAEPWTITVEGLAGQLICATETITSELHRLGILDKVRCGLEDEAAHLRALLEKRRGG